MTVTQSGGAGSLLAEVRELVLAAEDIIRTDWEGGESLQSGADVSVGTASATALDRVAQLGAALIDRQQHEALRLVVDTLARLYWEAETSRPSAGQGHETDLTRAIRRRDVTLRVYVMGALATYHSWFAPIRDFVLQPADPRHRSRFWLRDTVTLLSRANEFAPKSLIPLVADYVVNQTVLFRRFRANQNDVVSALCQFDFLQCVVAVGSTKRLQDCYPNFGAYANDRVAPLVESLVGGGPARMTVRDVDDDSLATIIKDLDGLANNLFFSFAGWLSDSWGSSKVEAFLASHPPPRQ